MIKERYSMNPANMNNDDLTALFTVIGLSNKKGVKYWKRAGKCRQVFDFLIQIEKAIKNLSSKRTLTLIDCACGRSYLSFITNYYLLSVLNKKVDFICIDYNSHVIEQSIIAAESLGFDNMRFICDDIFNVRLSNAPDIIYSLHACDTATDMTIAKGILEQANYIMTVSCCQHYVRSHIKGHPLTSMTRYGAYKERMADMLSDTMRSLILEEAGYLIDLFEYVPASETPKNIMIRAVKGSFNEKRSERARCEYDKLKSIFNTEPKLHEYLDTSIMDCR
jgi:hypothetical protein